jgi:hypothetical protein
MVLSYLKLPLSLKGLHFMTLRLVYVTGYGVAMPPVPATLKRRLETFIGKTDIKASVSYFLYFDQAGISAGLCAADMEVV